MKVSSLLIGLLLLVNLSQAGTRDFVKKTFNQNQDFDATFIYAITQDEDGFLWIGSDGGLYRYDGIEMENRFNGDSTTNLVTATAVTNDGHLVVGYFDGKVKILEHGQYRTLIDKEQSNSKITAIVESENGELLVLTQNHGLFIYSEGSVTSILSEKLSELIALDMVLQDSLLLIGTNEGLITTTLKNKKIGEVQAAAALEYIPVNSIIQDPEHGVYWLATDEGVYQMSQSDLRLKKLALIPNVSVKSLAKDGYGSLWVGTANDGLIQFDINKQLITSFNTSTGFESNQISELYVDREDEIWVGTFGKGLVQLNRAIFHHYELKSQLRVTSFNAMLELANGELLMGTEQGLIKAFNREHKDSLNFEKLDVLNGVAISTLFQSGNGLVWIGTKRNGLYNYNAQTGELNKAYLNPVDEGSIHLIRHITQDQSGNLHVSVSGNGVYTLDHDGVVIDQVNTRTNFYHNEIFSILADEGGNLWYGAHAVGLALKKPDGSITYLTRDEIFPGKDVNSIIQDKGGNIWIATAGDGLFSFDGKSFECYRKKDGLLSNFCNGVMVDDLGNVWVSHREGLSMVRGNFGLIQQFYHPDELGETETLLNSIYKTSGGDLLFGNPNGFTKVIQPHLQFRMRNRDIHITDIRLFFENTDLTQFSKSEKIDNILPGDMEFGHKKNHLTFDFVSINLKDPDAIYYQYMLKGYDKKWSPVVQKNNATYTNLSPGKYEFLVRESEHPELWTNRVQSITFEIDYPFWQKWWFYLLEILFIGLIIFLGNKMIRVVQSRLASRLILYVSVFILFEFIHTEFEPYMESISGEIPIFQVMINLVLALVLFPIEIIVVKLFKKKEKKALAPVSS